MVDGAVTRRRGRPPDTDSADTRRAIIDNARRLFAERGYGGVTNKELAAASGITTGALYHYVESKLDLYVDVHSDMQRRVYGRFVEAVRESHTFLGKFEGILEAAHRMNVEDPSLALFVGTVRNDMRRFPEIAARLAQADTARDEFFVGIVDTGVATGEVRPDDREGLVEFIRIMLIGLTEGTSQGIERHRCAIDAIQSLLRGDLLRAPDR
jgi:TetR/AcrR family fatty acid metabolism transcriptional regulator